MSDKGDVIKLDKTLHAGMRRKLRKILVDSEKDDDESSGMFGNLGWDDRFDEDGNPIPDFLSGMEDNEKKPPQGLPTPIRPRNPTPKLAPKPVPSPAPEPMSTSGMLHFSSPVGGSRN